MKNVAEEKIKIDKITLVIKSILCHVSFVDDPTLKNEPIKIKNEYIKPNIVANSKNIISESIHLELKTIIEINAHREKV